MKGVLFTFAVCFGGAAAGVVWPFVALLAYVCFAIVRPVDLWYYSLPIFNYSRVITVGLFSGWALRGFGDWRFGKASLLVWTLVLYWIWATLRAFGAPNQDMAWSFVGSVTKIVLPFIVGLTVVKTLREVRWLMWTIAASQGYLALEFNQWYFSGYNRLWLEGFGTMDNNSNAIALVACVGVCLFLGIYEKKWLLKAAAFGCLALIIHAILFSFSRGGMLALIVTGITAFLMLPKRPLLIGIYAVGLVASLSLVGPEVAARFGSSFAEGDERDASAESRLELWSACLDIMRARPLGIGTGQFADVAPDYGFPKGKFAHSLWLQIGAELGFPGLGLLILFFGGCIARMWPLARSKPEDGDPFVSIAGRMVITSLVGFAVAAQFVSLYALEQPYYIALIGVAVLKIKSAETAHAPEPQPVVDDEPGFWDLPAKPALSTGPSAAANL